MSLDKFFTHIFDTGRLGGRKDITICKNTTIAISKRLEVFGDLWPGKCHWNDCSCMLPLSVSFMGAAKTYRDKTGNSRKCLDILLRNLQFSLGYVFWMHPLNYTWTFDRMSYFLIVHISHLNFSLLEQNIPPNLHLASSEQWCWSGERGILTELSLCYSIV